MRVIGLVGAALVLVLGIISGCSKGAQEAKVAPITEKIDLNGSPNVSVLHQAISAREVFARAIDMLREAHNSSLEEYSGKKYILPADMLRQQKWKKELHRLGANSTQRTERLELFKSAFAREDLGNCSEDCVAFPAMAAWNAGQYKIDYSSRPCFMFAVAAQRYLTCSIGLAISGSDGRLNEIYDTPLRGVARTTWNYVISFDIDGEGLVLLWGDRLYFSRVPDVDLAASVLLGNAIADEQLVASRKAFKFPLDLESMVELRRTLSQAEKVYAEEQGPNGAPMAWQRLYPAESRCVEEGPRQFIKQAQMQSLEVTVQESKNSDGIVVAASIRVPAAGISGDFVRGKEACLLRLKEESLKLRGLN